MKKIYCPNAQCELYQRVGLDNIIGKGYYPKNRWAKRYLCKSCGRTFSYRTGTTFYRLRVPKKDFLEAVQLMAEGLSIAGIARVKQVSELTVTSWFKKVAVHCNQFSDPFLVDLGFTQCQIDDFWSFVKKKKSISDRMKTPR